MSTTESDLSDRELNWGEVDRAQFREAQRTDPSLASFRSTAERTDWGPQEDRIVWEERRLYRVPAKADEIEPGVFRKQLIVPREYRARLLSLVHDIPLAGHLGIRKTRARLLLAGNKSGC